MSKSDFGSRDKNKNGILICCAVIALFAAVTIFSYFNARMAEAGINNDSSVTYEKEYALIARDTSDEFWSPVYQNMKKYAEDNGIYLQWMGMNIAGNYSWEDNMEIAIDSDVDGIILEADDTEECSQLIRKAKSEGIPVVTVRNDSPSSDRISYVGVSYYNLGTEYGNLIADAVEGTENDEQIDVTVLIDKNSLDASQNTILLAIQEQLSKRNFPEDYIKITPVAIDSDSDFSAEESIQDMLKGSSLPDIIVCLNEINTISVYQAIVEQNRVGDTVIIGYSDADTILKAIKKENIYATITVDVEQLGNSCVEALKEYSKFGRVSDYYSVNFTVIDKYNVYRFTESEEADENS